MRRSIVKEQYSGVTLKFVTGLDPPAKQQNGVPRRCRCDVVLRFAKLYFLLDVKKPRHCRDCPLERIHTFELAADVRCLPPDRGAQRNSSPVGVPNDTTCRLWR